MIDQPNSVIEVYGMCSANDHIELLDYVNNSIQKGFQPYGHPFTTIQHNILFIHQAMVMHEVKKNFSMKKNVVKPEENKLEGCHLLREFNDFIFYDGGKHEDVAGLNKLLIFKKDEQQLDKVLHTLYFDYEKPAELNKAIESAKQWVNETTGADKVNKDSPKIKERACRVCGCTQNNCQQCIEKTGGPCHWVEEDLCSACVEEQKQPIVKSAEATTVELVPSGKFPATNFFSQIFLLMDGIDVNMTLKRINGKMTVEVFPQMVETMKPVELKGTVDEMDAGFFEAIQAPMEKAKGLIVTEGEFKKEKAKSATTNKNVAAPAKPVKKAVTKKPVKKEAPPKVKPAKSVKPAKPGKEENQPAPTPLFS